MANPTTRRLPMSSSFRNIVFNQQPGYSYLSNDYLQVLQGDIFLNVSETSFIIDFFILNNVYYRHKSKCSTPTNDKENVPPGQVTSRLYGGGPQSINRLIRPFKCPGSATPTRASDKPARKKRKVNYAGADGSTDDGEQAWTNEERLALANRDVNKFPVFKVKDKDALFRQRFAVPLINKNAANYNPFRPSPTLGMRTGAVFIAKPLHDPSGEFAIVLYDPTIDNKPAVADASEEQCANEEKPELDVPIMHKSLADILGLKKQVDDHPKIPVVIDPRLAKVLRPHQVEGVKVNQRFL